MGVLPALLLLRLSWAMALDHVAGRRSSHWHPHAEHLRRVGASLVVAPVQWAGANPRIRTRTEPIMTAGIEIP